MKVFNYKEEEFYILLTFFLLFLFFLNYLNILQIVFLYLFFIFFKVYFDIILFGITRSLKGFLYYE
jgi:hypothetical protein